MPEQASPFPATVRPEPMAVMIADLFWDHVMEALAQEIAERAKTGLPPHTLESGIAARQAALAAYCDALLPAGNA